MTFVGIPKGASVFLDANTLVYYFLPHPTFGPICKALMRRITAGEVAGFVTAHVLTDVAHRLMTLEAITQLNWP